MPSTIWDFFLFFLISCTMRFNLWIKVFYGGANQKRRDLSHYFWLLALTKTFTDRELANSSNIFHWLNTRAQQEAPLPLPTSCRERCRSHLDQIGPHAPWFLRRRHVVAVRFAAQFSKRGASPIPDDIPSAVAAPRHSVSPAINERIDDTPNEPKQELGGSPGDVR